MLLILLTLFVSGEAVFQNTSCPEVSPRELDWKELDGKWYISAVATDLQIGHADCAMLMFTHMDSPEMSISWISNNTVHYHNGSVAIAVDPNGNSSIIGDLLKITDTDQKSESYSFLDVDYQHYAVLFSCHDNEEGNSSTLQDQGTKLIQVQKRQGDVKSPETPQHWKMSSNSWTGTECSCGLAPAGTNPLLLVSARCHGCSGSLCLGCCRDYRSSHGSVGMFKPGEARDEIWKLIRSPHLKESDAVKLDEAIANYSLQDTPFITFNNTEESCTRSGSENLDSSVVMLTSVAAYAFFNKLF